MDEKTRTIYRRRFDAAAQVPRGELAVRIEEEGGDEAFEGWLQHVLGIMQVSGYKIDSKATRNWRHKRRVSRTLERQGLQTLKFPARFL
jgi:hypothetical protein